ncbi:MAG TPA: hypothetical protein VGP31_04790 [Planosporangium sp.]|jgi:hypothetical protein|nr:hypothetical protein [Planosporangium sp.]
MRKSSPAVPDGVTAGFIVFDRTTGATTVQHNAHQRFRAASLVKILIALDRLEATGRRTPPPERALLESMLRSSDDDAADRFWDNYGGPQIVKRMITKLDLTESAPPPADHPGWWGYTALTASDVVKTYRYVLERADPRIRDVIMGNLRRSTRYATDGHDQSFGIPSAVNRPWAVKQGWSRFPDPVPVDGGRASPSVAGSGLATGTSGEDAPDPPTAGDLDLTRRAMHTSGTIGAGDRRILAVLTLHGLDTPWSESAARITALTRAVDRAGRA